MSRAARPPSSPPPASKFKNRRADVASPGLVDRFEYKQGRRGIADTSELGLRDENFRRAIDPGWRKSREEILKNKKKLREEKAAAAKAAAADPAPKKKQEFQLDAVHRRTLKTIFTLLDGDDQDKLLNKEQLRIAIISLGIPPSNRLIQEIIDHVPSWASTEGGVDFDTFERVITDRLKCNPVHMADIDELFRVFELPEEKGRIDEGHLRHLMQVKTTNNTNLSEDEVDMIFRELDYKVKQKVDYRLFLQQISSGFVNFEFPKADSK